MSTPNTDSQTSLIATVAVATPAAATKAPTPATAPAPKKATVAKSVASKEEPKALTMSKVGPISGMTLSVNIVINNVSSRSGVEQFDLPFSAKKQGFMHNVLSSAVPALQSMSSRNVLIMGNPDDQVKVIVDGFSHMFRAAIDKVVDHAVADVSKVIVPPVTDPLIEDLSVGYSGGQAQEALVEARRQIDEVLGFKYTMQNFVSKDGDAPLSSLHTSLTFQLNSPHLVTSKSSAKSLSNLRTTLNLLAETSGVAINVFHVFPVSTLSTKEGLNAAATLDENEVGDLTMGSAVYMSANFGGNPLLVPALDILKKAAGVNFMQTFPEQEAESEDDGTEK